VLIKKVKCISSWHLDCSFTNPYFRFSCVNGHQLDRLYPSLPVMIVAWLIVLLAGLKLITWGIDEMGSSNGAPDDGKSG
jgi:hypothetical protein